MSPRGVLRVVPVLLCLQTLRASADELAVVREGAKVRVWSPQGQISGHVGRLVTVDEKTLTVDLGDAATPTVLERALVTRIQVSQGRKRHVALGALIGFATGAALGALIYANTEDAGECCAPEVFAGVTGGLGALAGGLVGAVTKTERWQDVPLAQPRVRSTPDQPGRFMLTVTVRF